MSRTLVFHLFMVKVIRIIPVLPCHPLSSDDFTITFDSCNVKLFLTGEHLLLCCCSTHQYPILRARLHLFALITLLLRLFDYTRKPLFSIQQRVGYTKSPTFLSHCALSPFPYHSIFPNKHPFYNPTHTIFSIEKPSNARQRARFCVVPDATGP